MSKTMELELSGKSLDIMRQALDVMMDGGDGLPTEKQKAEKKEALALKQKVTAGETSFSVEELRTMHKAISMLEATSEAVARNQEIEVDPLLFMMYQENLKFMSEIKETVKGLFDKAGESL